MSSIDTEFRPSTQQIRYAVATEIASLGGVMSDVADDGHHLFVRAVLETTADVRTGDAIRAGVAVRSTNSEILVHPYTFRLLCTNGAIVAHALPARHLERLRGTDVFVSGYDVDVILADLSATVRACAAPEVFAIAADEMRSSLDIDAGAAIQMLSSLARMPQNMIAHLMPQILRRIASSGERSAFGVVNAVTSVARDTRDAATRWTLEKLGGALAGRLARTPPAASMAGV